MEWVTIFALALTVSLDGFAAGVAYGTRKIKLPVLAICLISITSAVTMYISMSIGSVLRDIIPEQVASILGAVLLISLGAYFVQQQCKSPSKVSEAERDILHFRIASMGLVIRVWHDPLLADSDKSGSINSGEAIVLGIALALDAFGSGLGAAMTGLPPLTTAMSIGLSKFILVNLGLSAGGALASVISPKSTSLLPGLLLIVLGVGHLL
ncbi:MAG: ytaF [Bacillota bacterium]|nr:MAG: ytaF [Bacillota bacterium]MBS3949959.1 sporulation membrane protein YtaF [Peptococcaceae bacterium]